MWIWDELAEDEDYPWMQKRMFKAAGSSSNHEENRTFIVGFLAGPWRAPSQRTLPYSTQAHQRSQKDKEKTSDAKFNLPSALEEGEISKHLKIGLWEEMWRVPIKKEEQKSLNWIIKWVWRWRYKCST